jgi:hypothetical protein
VPRHSAACRPEQASGGPGRWRSHLGDCDRLPPTSGIAVGGAVLGKCAELMFVSATPGTLRNAVTIFMTALSIATLVVVLAVLWSGIRRFECGSLAGTAG